MIVTKDMKLRPKRQADKPDQNDGTLEGPNGEKIIL